MHLREFRVCLSTCASLLGAVYDSAGAGSWQQGSRGSWQERENELHTERRMETLRCLIKLSTVKLDQPTLYLDQALASRTSLLPCLALRLRRRANFNTTC